MKVEVRYCLFVAFLFGSFLSANALQASPQDALEELATADKIDTVVKHLPVKVQEYVDKLPAKEKAAFAEKSLLNKNLERSGGKLSRSDTASAWELVEKDGAEKTLITFKNTYVTGADALVELEIKGKGQRRAETIIVGMRLEDGEWRVHHVGNWQKTDLEEQFIGREVSPAHASEIGAASTLRILGGAIATYETSYPAQGCPPSLQALSGQENQVAAPDHAMLVDPGFLQEPAISNGYEFRYLRIDQEHYQITATPVRMGEGQKSLFMDDTSIIRVTSESRSANANDPPLED